MSEARKIAIGVVVGISGIAALFALVLMLFGIQVSLEPNTVTQVAATITN